MAESKGYLSQLWSSTKAKLKHDDHLQNSNGKDKNKFTNHSTTYDVKQSTKRTPPDSISRIPWDESLAVKIGI